MARCALFSSIHWEGFRAREPQHVTFGFFKHFFPPEFFGDKVHSKDESEITNEPETFFLLCKQLGDLSKMLLS